MAVLQATEPITSANGIIAAAKKLAENDRVRMIAVAGAQDIAIVGALAEANADGILKATLFGDRDKINELAEKDKIDISKMDVVHETDAGKATYGAVKMAAEGNADVVMKGFVSTSALLKAVLTKEFKLRVKNTLSHCAVLDIPGYHKLLSMTDGGMMVKPDRAQKIDILENAVLVARALGIKPVKIALSGAVDKIYDSVAGSLECGELMKEFAERKPMDVEVQGPLTFDAATSKTIATRKGLTGPVAGNADVYISDTIEECNIVAKTLINFVDAVFSGVIVGARIPVSLVSRTDTMINKKSSVSIACLLAAYYDQLGGGEA